MRSQISQAIMSRGHPVCRPAMHFDSPLLKKCVAAAREGERGQRRAARVKRETIENFREGVSKWRHNTGVCLIHELPWDVDWYN